MKKMRADKREKRLSDTFSIKSIRLRLLLIMLGLMFVSLSVLTGLSYYFSDRALTTSVKETAGAIGLDYSKRASAFVNELVIYVEAVAVNPHIVKPKDRQEIVDELAFALGRNAKFTGINYGDAAGNMIRAQGDTAYLGDREYYRKAVQLKKMIISEPLISKGSGRLSIAIAVPVLENGEVQAIIQATMPLDSLTDMVQDIKFMDSGYGFLVDKSGVILAHALKPELNGKVSLIEAGNPSLANDLAEMDQRLVALFEKAASSSSATQGTYNIAANPIFTVFTPVELPGEAHWLMAVSAPASEVTRAVAQLNAILVLAALACIAGGVLVIILISRRFARPEEKYFKAFRHVGDAIGIVNIRTEKFIEANDAFFKILGYCREEVIGCRSEDFALWADGGNQEIYAALKQGAAVDNRETFWQTKDRRLKVGLLSADAMQVGDEQYLVFVWHDITAQKQAETALRQAYDDMEQKVEERTQELFAANQELTAMNEEMIAVNEELGRTNAALHEENHNRRQAEDRLLLRERQYRATTSLLTRPADEAETLAETVLRNAVQLVEATDGFIGMYSEDGAFFVMHCGIDLYEPWVLEKIPVFAGPLQQVYETGEVFQAEDCLWHSNLQEEGGKAAAMIFVPLKQQAQVKGLLAASWSGLQHEINEVDVAVLQQFADLAFLAIERAQTQAKIHHTAFYDVLTDLPNRVSLNLRLEEELYRARCGETEGLLLFIDMDDLKAINDTFGHSAGDKVILAAGNCLRAAFSEEAFVSRISGDEFIVIVPGSAAVKKATEIADCALRQLCRDYPVAEEQIQMSASIGLALYPQDGDRAEDLLKKADAAMYAAKASGRNCWRFFEPALLQKTADDMLMINDLRRGIVRNEFFLQYQPQLTVDGTRVVGLEALLRWNSPEYGLVPPSRFIPLAERSSLILEIGQWVFQEVCYFAKRLADQGKGNIRVAVNISPRQIKDENFIAFIRETIEANDIQPGQIEIEITENLLMDNLEDSVHKLRQLQQYGMKLALDDFGTGFSSLTYLRTLPVNCLKIDKSFIDKIASNDMQGRFVDSIIQMGHTLEMGIIAEGVETQQQLEKLAACRCDYIQGYVFSKPVAAEAAIRLCLQAKPF